MKSLEHIVIILLYIFCTKVLPTNSRTSSLWKLNSDQTKIVEAGSFHKVVSYPEGATGIQFVTEDDPVFNIITSTVHLGETWIKERMEYYCTNCQKHNREKNQTVFFKNSDKVVAEETLDCGKPVNFTYYDNLVGVLNRQKHPHIPEPQAALLFSRKGKKSLQEFDFDALERRLRKAKREKPKSVQLYNQIGNFWRAKGHSERAIECFRRALAASPHNAEALLNLARTLFNLQYLDDAAYLTRRSIEVQPPDKGVWQQYFTLGQILKAYGHYQEASIHLKHALELRPGFEPAEDELKEMETVSPTTVHYYTLVIIVCLVSGVLLVILSSVETAAESECETKGQRHFNKAMAMRSLRGLGQKRSKKFL